MTCRLHGPRFDFSRSNYDEGFWLGSAREFDTFDAAVIFTMELVPRHDLDKIEIHTDSGELHTILTIARRYHELTSG